MALSQENKYKVIFALGLPGQVIDIDSMDFNSTVSRNLNVDNEFIEAQVIVLLADIDSIKEKLKSLPSKGNVKQIGDIILDTEKTGLLVSKELARLVDELSKLLQLPNCSRSSRNMANVRI